MFGVDNPWAMLVYYQCTATVSTFDNAFDTLLNINIYIPMAVCVCKNSRGYDPMTYVVNECAAQVYVFDLTCIHTCVFEMLCKTRCLCSCAPSCSCSACTCGATPRGQVSVTQSWTTPAKRSFTAWTLGRFFATTCTVFKH